MSSSNRPLQDPSTHTYVFVYYTNNRIFVCRHLKREWISNKIQYSIYKLLPHSTLNIVCSLPSLRGARCIITDECWKFVTSMDMSGYSLTHQLLYLLIGINVSICNDFFPKCAKTSTLVFPISFQPNTNNSKPYVSNLNKRSFPP